MASTIKVDKIEGSTGSTITVPTGQTLTITDGLAIGSLPTVTVAKGGTNLTSFAAGDVLYATGSTTLAKLAKGSAADVLTMNSGATAPEWAAAAGGGKIGQVVQAVKTDRQSTTSTSYVDLTDMSATITPAATSSKVLVITSVVANNHDYHTYWKVTDTSGGDLTDFRGDSGHGEQTSTMGHFSHHSNLIQNSTQIILHSPSTTSATVYKVRMKVSAGTGTINYQVTDTDTGTGTSSITLMEILA